MSEQAKPLTSAPTHWAGRAFRQLLWAWLITLQVTQLLLRYALRESFSPLKPITSVIGVVPFVAVWLPSSFLAVNFVWSRINRSSFKAWPLLLAFPIVLAVSFVTSLLGVALAELLHNNSIKSLALHSWGLAAGSAILTAPLLALACLWLARRYRAGQPA